VHQAQVFDLARGTWSPLAAPRVTRFGARLVAAGGRLWLVGGAYRDEQGEKRGPRWLEVYDPRGASWSTALEDVGLEPQELAAFPYGDRLLLYSALEPGVTRLAFVDLPRPEDLR